MAQNRPISKLVLAVAGWFRYLMGTDEQGNPIEIDDPLASELQARARQGGTDPRPLLGLRRVFGDLGDNQPFVALLAAALESLSIVGAREAVRQAMHA
jgi:fructuronate reductase/mannitol 2-dehydrogenase